MKKSDYICLLLILVPFIIFRLLVLDAIPAELFGDVIEHLRFIGDLRKTGLNFSHWWGGDGPMHTHFAYLVTSIFGYDYWSMKLTSQIIGILVSVSVWHLAFSIFKNRVIAFFALLFCLTSFWHMSQSVSGKAHIYAALFSSLTVIMYISGKRFLTGLVIGLGIYSQVTFWGMALFALLHPFILAGFLLMSSYFVIYSFAAHGGMFSGSSYLGSKMVVGHETWQEKILTALGRIWQNIEINFLSLFYRGDGGFRHNVPFDPHLDIITFIFFIVGVLVIMLIPLINQWNKISPCFFSLCLPYRQSLLYIFIPLFLSQATSLMVLSGENEANISRMAGALPFICLLSAAGAYYLYRLLEKVSVKAACIIIAILFVTSATLNFEKFLIRYPAGLPNNNTPFGKLIAQRLDLLPSDYNTFTIDCCWGGAGQPEPEGINKIMKSGRSAPFVYPEQFTNKEICPIGIKNRDTGSVTLIEEGKNYAFAARPDFEINMESLPCLTLTKTEILEKNGHKAARIFLMRGAENLISNRAADSPDTAFRNTSK